MDALQEWIAFHLAVGVEHFIIADIGSSDGSYAYLRELKRLGLVTLVRPAGVDDTSSEPFSSEPFVYHSLLAACPATLDIVAFIDVDEFLLPLDEDDAKDNSAPSGLNRPEERIEESTGDWSTNVLQPNGLRSWLGDIFSDPDVSALALNSACFGSSGERFRGDGLVIERFTQRSSRTFRYNRFYKSVVRPSRVRHFDNERHAVLKTGHYVNSRGAPLQMVEERPGVSRRVCWQGVRINHYAVKSVEEFVLGQVLQRTSSVLTATQGDAYFSRFDRNARECYAAKAWASHVYLQALSLPSTNTFAVAINAPRQSWWRKTLSASFSWWKRARYAFVHSHSEPLKPPITAWKRTWPQQSRVLLTQRGVLLQASLSVAGVSPVNCNVQLACRWQEGVECVFPATRFEFTDGESTSGTVHFRVELPVRAGNVTLSAVLTTEAGELRIPLERLTLMPDASAQELQASALIGRQGWLFLDQDTNASLYQHLGYISLRQEAIDNWVAYAEQLTTLSGQVNANVLMVVAPNKERVMHAYHPYPMGAVTPVDRVVEALPDDFCLYPEALLKQMGDDAYHMTDTHWTQQGAMHVACEAVSRLGLAAREDAKRWFAEDQYKVVRVRGDLGSKLNPVRMAATPRLSSFDHQEHKRYDNGLPNFGRVIVWENSDAFLDQCCLVMGASSSYMMFPFLVRIFRRVVFVHSAGNIDASLVQAVSTQTVLVQTNARFMVRAPQLTWSLHDTILEKTEGVSMEEHTAAFAQRMPADQAALADWGLAKWNDCLPEGWFSA
ncbi:glycosyltransferase family 2 protein [Halomonas sp. AOP35-4E-18]|uniref:glycosyltransferase family 2 protein n=1 Tax=Halomonas sp. AOP35-4E-18 TaxID=3457686 RepID=UPI00403327E7